MTSLYDVFSAIRDDEGDHVKTMEACLDPSVAKLSPSLEKKVILGIATAAAFAYFLGTGDDVGISDGTINEVVGEGVESSGLVDAVIAGVAGVVSQLGQDPEEGEAAAVVGADLVEGGVLTSALQNLGKELLAILTKII